MNEHYVITSRHTVLCVWMLGTREKKEDQDDSEGPSLNDWTRENVTY